MGIQYTYRRRFHLPCTVLFCMFDALNDNCLKSQFDCFPFWSNREYLLSYRGTGFLAVVWFSSFLLPPPPLSRQQVVSLSQSSCVSPVELTHRGGGEESNPRTARKLVLYNPLTILWDILWEVGGWPLVSKQHLYGVSTWDWAQKGGWGGGGRMSRDCWTGSFKECKRFRLQNLYYNNFQYLKQLNKEFDKSF
jgi:hypothetical protein